MPNAIKLATEYNLDFYVLLIEEGEGIKMGLDYLKAVKPDIKVLVLKAEYGKGRDKKYRKFLAETTPSKFENIPGMSKYIIFNKKGQVTMVTNWKDNQDTNWKDDTKMIENTIIPVLTMQ